MEGCICDPSAYTEKAGECILSNDYLSDGTSIRPFKLGWLNTVAVDAVNGSDGSFPGIPNNGWYLFAKGDVSELLFLFTKAASHYDKFIKTIMALVSGYYWSNNSKI